MDKGCGIMAQYLAGQSEISHRTHYLQQGIAESLLLAHFTARVLLGIQRAFLTSPNPLCRMRATSANYSAILSFFCGPWQLWRAGFSWHSMRPIFSATLWQPPSHTSSLPLALLGLSGSLPHAFSSSITSVFICSHLHSLFSVSK